MRMTNVVLFLFALSNSVGWQACGRSSERLLPQLLEESGVHGGLVVCIGCDQPELLVSLRRSPSFVVQGLDLAPEKVKRARAALRAANTHGPVSVQHWNPPRLPYVDNLVNVLVVMGNLLADIGYVLADPRVSLEGRGSHRW